MRVGIGLHFVNEGWTKIQSGTFTAEGYIKNGKGPVAKFMQTIISDKDGKHRLCLDDRENPDDPPRLNPELTMFIWEAYRHDIGEAYKFGDQERIEEIATSRTKSKLEIEKLRGEGVEDTDEKLSELIAKYESDEKKIELLRSQNKLADEALARRKSELVDFIDYNREDILNYFNGAQRLSGFERDGNNKSLAALEVPTLRYQMAEIKTNRNKDSYPWIQEIEAAWDGYEKEIDDLILPEDKGKHDVQLFRPFGKEPALQAMDAFIPYFDFTVGLLLFLGLFTRYAALAGAGFLMTICLQQWPFHPESVSTIYQFIEMSAMLVLAATCAGRFAGLDYFLYSTTHSNQTLEEDDS